MSTIASEHQVISQLLSSPVQKMSTALDPLFSSVNMASIPSPAASPEPGNIDLTGNDNCMTPTTPTAVGGDMQMKYEPYIDIDSVCTCPIRSTIFDFHICTEMTHQSHVKTACTELGINENCIALSLFGKFTAMPEPNSII